MPQTKISGEELLNELKNSFKDVDSDLSALFNNMVDNGYIDLVQRENKVNFSITNYLTESCIPVITGNYKNNYLDVQTTCHEMGHSFQKYCASIKDKEYIVSPLLKYPTMEIAEMFSYSMELIMMKHVENIFNEEDYKKYCFMKIYNLLVSLPYICLVDEFQETIYSKKSLKQEDIRKTWIKLVKKYHLERSNSGHINLDEGGYFYRQSHIYLDPFYYIDYALSYFGAFSIWNESDNNLDVFKEVGSVASYYSFKELIKKYNMPNPFDKNTVEEVSNKLKSELEKERYYE
jgi:M3 family oligoendopeptidase